MKEVDVDHILKMVPEEFGYALRDIDKKILAAKSEVERNRIRDIKRDLINRARNGQLKAYAQSDHRHKHS